MPNMRKSERKPLSFSTTMRNPARIAAFLNCLLPFEGQILTNEIIYQVIKKIIQEKIYYTMYILKNPQLKAKFDSEEEFSEEEIEDIIKNSPQDHKEAGFDKGWPSRFDTWYKLPMEFGFIFYEMNSPILFSATGHMLIDSYNEKPINYKKIQNVFLNSLIKYQTNNPFRKNLNFNAPLILLLQTIYLFKTEGKYLNGIQRIELPLLICYPNNNARGLYLLIQELRKAHGFHISEEIIYEKCLELLEATPQQRNRFKIEQITGEAVDEFIRKMRITGIISLRGNGRFVDFNSFESKKINYILEHYSNYTSYTNKRSFFEYMGSIDNQILTQEESIPDKEYNKIKQQTLISWAQSKTKQYINNELNILSSKKESKDLVLKVIDRPTRFEFLASIALKQNFPAAEILPNYPVDDEGLPTFTASGGKADIECFDDSSNPLVEVTLMTSKGQAANEIPAITRHLTEAISKYPNKRVFSVFIAPMIHTDTKYMIDFSKYKYDVDILAFNILEFIKVINNKNRLIDISI